MYICVYACAFIYMYIYCIYIYLSIYLSIYIYIYLEQLDNRNIDEDLATFILKKREDFCILRLKTLQPDGFNAELKFPNV